MYYTVAEAISHHVATAATSGQVGYKASPYYVPFRPTKSGEVPYLSADSTLETL